MGLVLITVCRICNEKIVEGVEEHFARRHPRESFGKKECEESISKLEVMKLSNKNKILRSKEDNVKDVSR